ncbi:MAG: hypothetical protein ACJAYK_000759 [Crocinitomicaceae bacterium]|jgi:hypothetical protein
MLRLVLKTNIKCTKPICNRYTKSLRLATPKLISIILFISDNIKRQLMANIRQHFNVFNDNTGNYFIEIHPITANI